MKKVAIYCRVSSDDQKERDTIENQVELLNTFIEMKDDLSLYKEYLDNGVSGTINFEKRPGGKSLIEDAATGRFDIVLVYKIDRFGRDTLSGLSAVEMLRNFSIEIMSVTEPFDLNTPTGRFQFITYLNMAELERNNILDRMFLGATRAAKQGKWLGGIVPYGYKKDKDGYLEIIEEEANVVRKIYDLYINDKLSTINIAVYLNNLNISTGYAEKNPKASKRISGFWRNTTVVRIINATTYKGIHYYGQRGSRRKELIARKVPAIVTEEVWNMAQAAKKERTVESSRCNTKRDYLLRGMIKCKQCGRGYFGISYKDKSDVYCCSGKRNEPKKILGWKCSNINVNANFIENEVWSDCLEFINNFDEIVSSMTPSTTNDNGETITEISKLKESLEELKNEKNRILEIYRKQFINEEELSEQLKSIKKEEDSIQNLINALDKKLTAFGHEQTLIDNMSNILKVYKSRIDELTFEDKRDIVKLLVKEITVDTIVQCGERCPDIKIDYYLVKLDIYKDVRVNHKFDEHEKKFLPIICVENCGTKLKDLRLKSDMTMVQLADKI
ncbi:recombinase family protein, partial [Rhodopseudomonas parapalustris]